MKIKVNSEYPEFERLKQQLEGAHPDLVLKAKERKWGLERPSFKWKKTLYEFETLEELLAEVAKLFADSGAKGEEEEELVLEIPVEKYHLHDLNIQIRLGKHGEKNSTYEAEEQTLYPEPTEGEEAEPDSDFPDEDEEIGLTSYNDDIVLNLPAEKYSLQDLRLKIKFTDFGDSNSTYEVRNTPEESPEREAAEEEPVDRGTEMGPEEGI
ncbi:hypothetical protein KCG48_00255 [Proteiniclasticum sp. BAD-10]|uniref:Uncharacterized protein n=1 Tax=Proteiniclasticum sediminis TaxID=2804028 RepID=A0A941CLC2_9CLOT|nr:hypothetical protein [Proteiniclasticum sediminis]MBR0574760.1 hypothetical protein [Proteiniclasticum sediminis]